MDGHHGNIENETFTQSNSPFTRVQQSKYMDA